MTWVRWASNHNPFVMHRRFSLVSFFFFQAEDGIRDLTVTGVQTCALPILSQGRLDHQRALRQARNDAVALRKVRGHGAGAQRIFADDQPVAGYFAGQADVAPWIDLVQAQDRKSTRLNSSHSQISYAVFCLKKKKQ